jgi:hypothetical protein
MQDMAFWVYISLALIAVAFVKLSEGVECIKNNACFCTYDDGSGTVDFTELAGTSGPRYVYEVFF